MTDPRCIPESPPGYVFFSNYGKMDYGKGVERTEEAIYTELKQKYGFDDVIILRNVVPYNEFSVFLPNQYADWVKVFVQHLEEMLTELGRLYPSPYKPYDPRSFS